jgi:hypothetical protein
MLTKRNVMRGAAATALALLAPPLPARASNLDNLEAVCGSRLRSYMRAMFEASPTLWRQVADFLRHPRPVDLVLAGESDAAALYKMIYDAKLFPPLAIFDLIVPPEDEGKRHDGRIEAIRLVPEPYNGPWPTPHLRDSRIERLV